MTIDGPPIPFRPREPRPEWQDEARLLADMTRELSTKAEHMTIDFQPLSVVQLVGLVQLALRHPDLASAPIREAGEKLLAGARAYFSDCPAVLEVLRRGDHP